MARGLERNQAQLRAMKVATFNINGILRRLPNLLEWLRSAAPDVVCLQELKTGQNRFPSAALHDVGYTDEGRSSHHPFCS